MYASFSIVSFSIDAASAGQIAWFAADLGSKATLGLLAALAVTWGARRSSAALRHRVWFLTYCGLLLLPVLPLVVPKWQIPLPAAFDRIRPQASQTLPAVPRDSRPADPPNQIHPESQPEPDPVVSSPKDDFSWSADARTTREAEQRRTSETPIARSPAVTMPTLAVAATQPTRPPIQPPGRSAWFYVGGLMAVWLAGTAVPLFGILAARRRGRQLLRSAEPVLDQRWLEPFEQLRENLRVTLLESSEAVVPMATGILRHAVLLPRETEEWPTALRRYVLIHELAHVKRRDVLQHLICSVATALYWFHPLAWYGMRRMRLEREIACDDCVLMAGEHPCDYAAELVGIARRLHGIVTPWAVCMAGGSTLEGRVRSMLDRARSHGPLSAAAARLLVIVALAAITLLAAVEPGTSSIRQQTPTQSGVADVRASDNHGLAKDAPPMGNSPVDKHILAEANEKSSQQSVSKDGTYSFAGTVVDQQGRPIAAAKISLSYFRSLALAADPSAAVSDAHGRFEFSRKKSDLADLYDERYLSEIRVVAVKEGYGFASVPATACEKTGRLAAAISELKTSWPLLTAEKGSNVLTLVPDDVATSEERKQAPRDPKHAEPATENARLRLAGTVLKPNGDPAIGATVLLEGFLSPFAGGEGKWTLVAGFATDARGAFDRDFDGRWRPSDSAAVRLSAIMPGYGRSITAQPWTKDLRSIVLRLADDEPIRARILNLEGRPIAGVRIGAVQVYPSKKEWIDRWLAEIPPNADFGGIGRTKDDKVTQMKAVAQTAPHFPAASMELDPLAGLPSAVTDAEGKVEIRGLGRERLVLLKVVGPGVAAAKVCVLTHPTKTIEFNRGSRPVSQVFSIYGPKFDYIAVPGTVITGIVRDDETKKPIAGAIVASDALEGWSTSSGGNLSVITDVEGRYQFDGLSRNRRITITVTRPNSEYLETDIQVRPSRPFEPIRKDITLRRGVWAVGRAFNIRTGQPVAATLFYTPFRSNEVARKSRRSGTRGFLDDVPAGQSDHEGRFRIPILPGRGVIALRCAFGDYVPAFGAAKSRELSDRKTEVPTFDFVTPSRFHAVAEVDLKPDAAQLRIDLPVDPGQDVVFKFVDRAGHRLSGARVVGMTPRRDLITKTDTITIPATSPDETRIGWIKHKELDWTQHKEGGLCKFIHFKPIVGERERTITLEPPAVLTGRLVSPEGEPLRDVSVDCNYELSYNSVGGFPEVRTDARGRFRYEIPGGGPFHVASRSGSFFSLARDLAVEPGELVDFGELVVSANGSRSTVTSKSPPKRTLSPAADAVQKASTSSKKLGGLK